MVTFSARSDTGGGFVLKSKTLMGLVGVFVIAVLVWVLLNLWYVPTLGNFSCSPWPWFVAEAQAGDEGCPGSLDEAWNNADWAMDRHEEIAKGYQTTGLYYLDDGRRHKILSGDEKGADALRAERALRVAGAPSIRGRYPAASHVEVKVDRAELSGGAVAGAAACSDLAGVVSTGKRSNYVSDFRGR